MRKALTNKKTRGLKLAALFAAVPLALAGCQAAEPESVETAQGQAPTTVTKLSFFSWDGEATMAPLIEAFEDQNPDIEIEFSSAPPVMEYINTLQTRLLSGTAADVFILAAENKSSVIEGGYALNLSGEPFLDPIADFNRATYSGPDGVYGMSVASWGGGIVTNMDLLASVGVQEFPSNWDEFLELSANLKAAGIEPFYDNLQEIPMMLNALIGDSYNGDSTIDQEIFAGNTTFEEKWTPALDTFNDLFEQDLVSSNLVGLAGDQILSEFIGGRVAMLATGPWNIGAIRDGNPDLNFAFQPFPSPDGAGYLVGAASPGYAINSKTANVDAAKRFLTYLSSAEGIALYNQVTSAITTTSNVQPVLDESLAAIVSDVQNGNLYLAQISWPRSQDVLSAEAISRLQEMVLGQRSPAEVGAALDAKLAETE